MSTGSKSYGLIRVAMILLVLSAFIGLGAAFETSALQWADGVSYKLQRGGVVSYNGYTVEVTGFPPPVEAERYTGVPSESVNAYVGLNISKNGSFINTTALGLEESYITPDGQLKITATDMPSPYSRDWLYESYNPWALIELDPRGTPHLEVSVETDKNEYKSSEDTEIVTTVKLINTGSADAVNVDMNLQTELTAKRGSLKNHYERIKKGDNITETISLISPVITNQQTYGILANVSGYDVMNIPYTAEFQTNFTVAVDPQWSMSLRKSTLDKMYMKDTTMVSLSLKNNGKYEVKNVSIEDSLPSGFKLITNTSLHWVVNIQAGKEWEYRYLVKPEEPNANGVALPVATAEFRVKGEFYGIRSNQPMIIVYGPKVVLDKKTDVSEFNPGDNVVVTITAENKGSTPTKINITDSLPTGVTFVSGTTAHDDYLEAGKAISFSYTLKADSDQPIRLPPAIAEYYELGNKGGKVRTESQGLELRIKPPPTPVPTETPAVVEPPANSTSPDAVNVSEKPGAVEPVQDKRTADTPGIADPEMKNEINAFLNLLLGCDENGSINNGFNATACNFFQNKSAVPSSVDPQVTQPVPLPSRGQRI